MDTTRVCYLNCGVRGGSNNVTVKAKRNVAASLQSSLQSTVYSLQSTVYSLQSTVYEVERRIIPASQRC